MPSYFFETPGQYEITLDIINISCNQARGFTRAIQVKSSSFGYFSITPNPSSTFININPSAENTTGRSTQTALPVFDRIVITDAMGNVKLQQAVRSTSTYRIDVSRLPNGIYYLQLLSKGKLIEKKTIQIAK